MYYTDWFLNIKPSWCPWNNPHLFMVYNLFYTMELADILRIFVSIFMRDIVLSFFFIIFNWLQEYQLLKMKRRLDRERLLSIGVNSPSNGSARRRVAGEVSRRGPVKKQRKRGRVQHPLLDPPASGCLCRAVPSWGQGTRGSVVKCFMFYI